MLFFTNLPSRISVIKILLEILVQPVIIYCGRIVDFISVGQDKKATYLKEMSSNDPRENAYFGLKLPSYGELFLSSCSKGMGSNAIVFSIPQNKTSFHPSK